MRFRYQRCDIYGHLHMIYKYMLIVHLHMIYKYMSFLIEFAGGFIMFFISGNKERSKGDQSIIGDISIRSSSKHYCRLTVITEFLFQNLNIDHRNWTKTSTSFALLKVSYN